MTHLLQKINKRKLAAVLVLLVVLALSMTVVQKAASDPENHTGTIEALDEKKADVLKLTRQQPQPLRQFPEMPPRRWPTSWQT